MRIDHREVNILLDVHKRLSIQEMATRTGLSVAGVYQVLKQLEEEGLVIPPPQKGQARSRRLTARAIKYLEKNGFLNDRVING